MHLFAFEIDTFKTYSYPIYNTFEVAKTWWFKIYFFPKAKCISNIFEGEKNKYISNIFEMYFILVRG